MSIRTTELSKTYQNARTQVHAVDGLSFDVRAGEVFGLLGPNGAGKTTTVGMLTTRVRPTGGSAVVAGVDVLADPIGVKRRIGVVTQYNTLDRQLTVAENLEFRGRYTGRTAQDARRRAGRLLELFGLADRAGSMVHRLSGGQAQRVLIARALVHRPEVLFLDEPTSGLDPQTRVNLWDVLRKMRGEGQTILLTTHYLEEAENLCDRIGIVDHGRLLACDTLDGLKARMAPHTVLNVRLSGDTAAVAGAVGRVDGVEEAAADGTTMRVTTVRTEQVLTRLMQAAVDAGLEVLDLEILRPSLESLFLSLTGREYRD